jgi:acyl-CoA thioesterase
VPRNEGIENKLFQAIVDSLLVAPYYKLMCIELQGLGPGYACLIARPNENHANPLGLVHGGLVMSLADAAMGNAIRSTGIKAVTTDCTVNFFRPAPFGRELTGKGMVEKAGSRIVFTRAELKSGDTVIAQASGTFTVVGKVLEECE